MRWRACAQVVQWRDARRVVVEGPPMLKLREAEYLWQTSSYILWPAAAKALLARLPVDCPTDCYISKLVLEGFITAVVACPQIAEQVCPHAIPSARPDATPPIPRPLPKPERASARPAPCFLRFQRDPYEKGDIKHTNIYNWEEEKVRCPPPTELRGPWRLADWAAPSDGILGSRALLCAQVAKAKEKENAKVQTAKQLMLQSM